MSQCLQNLLDRHQKTGMEATHVSLTKRRKSPAPDVQLIQPQRHKQTPTTKKKKKKINQSRKEHMSPCPRKAWGLLSRAILFCLNCLSAKCKSSTEMPKKFSAAFIPSPLVLPEVTPSSWQRCPSSNTMLVDLHRYFSTFPVSLPVHYLHKLQKYSLGTTSDTGTFCQQCQVIVKLFLLRSLTVSHLV